MAGIAALVAVAGGDVDGHLGPPTASAGCAGGDGIGIVGRHCVGLCGWLSARHQAQKQDIRTSISGNFVGSKRYRVERQLQVFG